MTVRIVTDSTSDIPQDLAESLDITVVPLNVHFSKEMFKDGVDLTPDEFYRRLIDGSVLPKTSQPSVGEFARVYDQLSHDAEGIVSVHISSKLSGTYNSAIQAKDQININCQIEVIDTHQASMGLGNVAIASARAAQQGASLQEVIKIARQAIERSQCFVLLDTMEYLEKGGRIGKAKAMLGTLLSIKPMVIVQNGEVHELAKERTRRKGIHKLELVSSSFSPLDNLSVVYSTTPDEADDLANSLKSLLPGKEKPIITRFGPVLGTYVGPGALGIALLRTQSP